MNKNIDEGNQTGVVRLLGCFAVCIGLLFIPFVVNVTLPLIIIFFVISFFFIIIPHRVKLNSAALFFVVVLLLTIEVSVRYALIVFFPKVNSDVSQYMYWSNPRNCKYAGHPFLQFTGKPGRGMDGEFNNFGFSGRDFSYIRKEGMVRIVTIGESTTADGYPAAMESYLNQCDLPEYKSVEVFNFGMGWYTTAHSAVNFILNVVDFSPDYVVIMHAWNEIKAQCYPEKFRNDYSHVFMPFHIPVVHDRFLIRNSIVYSLVKMAIDKHPESWYIDSAVMSKDAWKSYNSNLINLGPYERNIRTIIDLALLRGMRPVLVTQPHSVNPKIKWGESSKHIDRCNVLLCQLAKEYGEKIVFVDLNADMTGKREDDFYDVGHVLWSGVEYKAKFIGDAIRQDMIKNGYQRKVRSNGSIK